MKVTQCSSRNFPENLPAWDLWAHTNPCAIFKALTTSCRCSCRKCYVFPRPRSAGLGKLHLFCLWTNGQADSCVFESPSLPERRGWCTVSAGVNLPDRNIPAQSHCGREVSDGSPCAERVCTRRVRSSLCVPTHRLGEEQVCCTFTHWFTACWLSLSGQVQPPYLRYCVWIQTNPWPRIWKCDEAKAASSAGFILPQEYYSEESWHFCTAASFYKGRA